MAAVPRRARLALALAPLLALSSSRASSVSASSSLPLSPSPSPLPPPHPPLPAPFGARPDQAAYTRKVGASAFQTYLFAKTRPTAPRALSILFCMASDILDALPRCSVHNDAGNVPASEGAASECPGVHWCACVVAAVLVLQGPCALALSTGGGSARYELANGAGRGGGERQADRARPYVGEGEEGRGREGGQRLRATVQCAATRALARDVSLLTPQ